MSAWAKMAVAVAVLVLPGGLVFLLGWAVTRAYVERLRAVRAQAPDAPLLQALVAISPRDIWREARQVTGIPVAAPGP